MNFMDLHSETLVCWLSGTVLQYNPNLYDLNNLKFNNNLLKLLDEKYSKIIFIIKYSDKEEQDLLKNVFKLNNLQKYQFIFIQYSTDTENLYKEIQNKIGLYDYLDSSRARLNQASKFIGKAHAYHISQFLN